MAAAANMAAGKVPGFRPLVLLAMIHGMQGFYLPAQLTPQYQGHRAHPQSVRHSSPWTRLLRRARPLHDLHAQLDFRAALGRKTTVTTAAEEQALGEYSPRVGDEAPPLKHASPEKSKVHLMGPTQYLSALGKCAAELETQGLDAVWVGGGQDTFYQALGVQLQNAGITRPVGSTGSTSAPNGYDFTPSSELAGTFPAACRQIRLDLVRCIISNVERLGQFAVGAERDLHAAAMRYQVRITCFEISDDGSMTTSEYLPQEGVDPRADLFLCRKGEHFVSARAAGEKGSAGFFCNLGEEEVLRDMRENAQYMGLKYEDASTSQVSQTQTLPQHAAEDEEAADVEVFTWASGPPRNVRGGRRLLREVVQVQAAASLDMPEKHYTAGGHNFFNALAAALERAGQALKSKGGAGGSGSVLDVETAARQARSEVIMYSTAHSNKFAGMPSPMKELAAAACKFNIKITCYELIRGVISKNTYLPNDGVALRAEIVLGCDGHKFWATVASNVLIEPSTVPLKTQEITEIPAGADIPVGYHDDDGDGVFPKASSSTKVLDDLNNDAADDGVSAEERGVVFDKKTLSWKMMTKEEQAKLQEDATTESPAPERTAGTSGNYLPRFSKFKSNPNSAAPPSAQATVADAMMAGEISSRNGRVNIDPVALAQRRASAGMTSDVQLSQGMLQLEAELAEQGKVIDLNQGGGNAYLVIAELMYTHKLQIQGLMFTMWGEERRNSLVGAMSRKAREDVKTYMYHNPDVFEKAGQWVGDHDCLAMARCYKVRIVVTRVIYDDQIEECIYEPEDGVKARGELHVILDRKLFWAVKSLEAFEKQAAGDDDDEVEEEEVVVKKPRSALEKVLAKYGTEDVDAKPAPAKVELATPGQREGGEKTLVGFQKVHTVKAVREHSATVIWLHGLGGDGTEWIDMAEALHMPWTKFIMPAAQPMALDLWQGSETSAWFDLSPGAYNVHSNSMNAIPEVISRIYRKIQPDFDKIESSAALIRELVRKEIRNGIPPEEIILAGFSQGATIALHAALSMEEQIGGVVALSMWHLPSITGSDVSASSARESKLPVLFCHGAKDRVITADFAKHMCGEMAGSLQVNYLEFDDLGHSICADELSAVRKFLLDHVPGQAKYDSLNALPPTYRRRDGGAGKSNAKVWGDGSEVSARRSNAQFQAVAAEDKQALDAMVEEAVHNNLEDFAAHFDEPGATLWVDLQRAAVHDKSKTRQQK